MFYVITTYFQFDHIKAKKPFFLQYTANILLT